MILDVRRRLEWTESHVSGAHHIPFNELPDQHYYQPLWTVVGGGRAPADITVRPEASVMPKGVTWIRGAAAGVDPDARTVRTADGQLIGYDYAGRAGCRTSG